MTHLSNGGFYHCCGRLDVSPRASTNVHNVLPGLACSAHHVASFIDACCCVPCAICLHFSNSHRGKKAAVKAAKASKSKVRAGTHPLLSMVALQLWSRWGWIGTGKPHISPFPRIEVSYADALNHTDDGRLMRTTGRSDCRGAIVVRVATGGPAAIWEAQRINGGKASKVGWSVFC